MTADRPEDPGFVLGERVQTPPGKPAQAHARLRLPLATPSDVSRQMARLYREARGGRIHVADASKLANMLALLGRQLEGGELADRLEQLEAAISSGRRS